MVGASRRVTFLLTDIEGSTRLLARCGARYPDLVGRHRRIILEAARRAGGHAVPLEGDSCLAVFPAAAAALAAAVDAQRGLTTHPWPPDGCVRVRMGLHTGVAIVSDGEYFGLDLHRAARITDAGHGGQVLLSASAHDAVAGVLPAGVGLADLGHHRLRDLEAPVRLFQVEADDLPCGFPPLRTLRGGAHNLPVQTSTLVGRDDEIAAVSHLLADHRLVTVTGPGGVGKTRLALHVGAQTIDAFPDGVWYIELAATADPAEVPTAIADNLGITVSTGDTTAMIVDRLRGRVALLIVDNLEHVITAAPVITDILTSCGDVRVLATSRERLLLTGEQTYDLRPLSTAAGDAVALFVTRARSHRPSFAPTPAELDDIAAICRIVDGLPLAIELAATQTRVLPVADVRARLAAGLDALRGGPRDRPARHRALRETIAWSYELLPDDERRLFARLAVFQGGRSLDAITAVCMDGLGTDVVAGLTALVDKSLVQRRIGPDGELHFTLLELIHEFAADALAASGEADAIHRRHAEWIAALAARADDGLLRPDAHTWEELLHQQLANIRVALRWAFGGGDPALGVRITAALSMFWYWGGPHTGGHEWVRAALDQPHEPDPATRGRLHAAQGYLTMDRDPTTARVHFETALDDFIAAGDRVRMVHGLVSVAAAAIGDPDRYREASQIADRAVSIAREFTDNPRLLADALVMRGELARAADDDPTAAACYEEALSSMRPSDDDRFVAIVTANLAAVARHRGDVDAALSLARTALTTIAKHNRPDMTASVLGEVAAHERAAGNVERAGVLLGASDAALARLGVRLQAADRLEHDRATADVGRALGARRQAALAAQGAAMPLDEAVALALASG